MSAGVVLLMVWIGFLRPTWLGGDATYLAVAGESMEPSLRSGDLVVARVADRYRPGDVVAYPSSGGFVIHRIVAVEGDELVTQGDNNPYVDWWRVPADEVLGKAWIRLPALGKGLHAVRASLLGRLAVASLAVLMVWSGPGAHRVGERRGGRRIGPLLAVVPPVWGAAAAAALALFAVVLVFMAFRTPAEEARFVEEVSYRHEMRFSYQALVEPASVYESTLLGPIAPEPGQVEAPPLALYARLTRLLDVEVAYRLDPPERAEVSGHLEGVLLVKAGERGWERTVETFAPVPFEGSEARARFLLDLDEVLVLVERAEEETGYTPGAYLIELALRLRVSGNVGGRAVDDVLEPSFTVDLMGGLLTPQSRLVEEDTRRLGAQVTVPARMGPSWASLAVTHVRWGAVAAALLTLALTAWLARPLLRSSADTPAGIAARYGPLLVGVASSRFDPATSRIRVASMRDLARLARRDGRVIFYEEVPEEGRRRYYLPHDEAVFEYLVDLDPEWAPS